MAATGLSGLPQPSLITATAGQWYIVAMNDDHVAFDDDYDIATPDVSGTRYIGGVLLNEDDDGLTYYELVNGAINVIHFDDDDD